MNFRGVIDPAEIFHDIFELFLNCFGGVNDPAEVAEGGKTALARESGP
jgi:hypothetical protein